MALFQKSVLKKYLRSLDNKVVEKAYSKYIKYFHDYKIQDNIRKINEEQYQEGFLRELFVNIFGYKINPTPNYNLTTERKNLKGRKKVDAAILNEDNSVLAVIELKGTKTKDIESIRVQAFDYKSNQTGCVYVITSNYEKLRFYIDDAVEFEEFDLFTLSKEQFLFLYLCIDSTSVLRNIPKKIKNESLIEEENITKKFYSDYSLFKRELYRDLVKRNTKNELFRSEYQQDDDVRGIKNIKLKLFSKSQKLIDRFLFIFFAEDRGLLSPNSILEVIGDWNKLEELDAGIPLYDRFKSLFNYLDIGRKGTDKKDEIFSYNGGLFKPDKILNSLIISDDLLARHTKKLSSYNFESQVDVNILGHIFENSLNDIESVNAQIEGGDFDKQKTKRKSDGVFYTPKYITKYIVDNTIGKLCREKRDFFGIVESEYFKNKKGRKKETLQKLSNILESYREWLLSLTVCDPACGSGAFLNEALDFLIKEHGYIDELQASLLGGAIVFRNIELTILERNIFGVDINEESVEIAKLSLWLRTAQPRRKLNNLNENIKCGNSLVESKAVSKAKFFNWEDEFPTVFSRGGFDIIIGNPPYVFSREKISDEEKMFYVDNYFSAVYQVNTYLLFIEKTVKLLKKYGVYGLIVPNAWLMISSGVGLREFLLGTSKINQVVNLEGYSFEGVNVETIILLAEKSLVEHNIFSVYVNQKREFIYLHDKNQNDFKLKSDYSFNIFSNDISGLLTEKLRSGSYDLDSIVEVKAGLQAYESGKGFPKQSPEDVKNRPYDYSYKFDENTHKYLEGSNVKRYGLDWSGGYLKYGRCLASPRTFDLFEGKKIIVREITGRYPKTILSTYTEDLYLYNRSNIAIVEKTDGVVNLKYITAVLNSSLMAYYFKKNTAKANRKMFPKIILNDLRKFPIKIADSTLQNEFGNLVDEIIGRVNEHKNIHEMFLSYVCKILSINKPSKKLKEWYLFDFLAFVSEIRLVLKNEGGSKISKSSEFDLMELFEDKKNELIAKQIKVDEIDRKIDEMVFDLYDLTPEEIKLVYEEQ